MPKPFWEKAYADLTTPAIRGGVPSQEICEIASQLPAAARVLDLGCGEGRNALFLAGCGFRVTAVDISEAGIRKLEALAGERRLDIRTRIRSTSLWPGSRKAIVKCCIEFERI
jgi:tellurite methyltransferase